MNNKKPEKILTLLFGISILLSISNLHTMNLNPKKNPDEIYIKDLEIKIKTNNQGSIILRNPIVFVKFCLLMYYFTFFNSSLQAANDNNYETFFFIFNCIAMIGLTFFGHKIIKKYKKIESLQDLKEIVKKLKAEKPLINNQDFEKKCPICMSEENNIEKPLYINNPCGHCYHIDCLKPWLELGKNSFKCVWCEQPLIKLIKSEVEQSKINKTD